MCVCEGEREREWFCVCVCVCEGCCVGVSRLRLAVAAAAIIVADLSAGVWWKGGGVSGEREGSADWRSRKQLALNKISK